MTAEPASERVRLRVDPWAAEYDGAAGQLDLEQGLASVDPKVEQARWEAVRPAAGGAVRGELAFVDGVRRIDCRFVAEVGGRRVPGLFGSFAVGAASCGEHARVLGERVGRIAAFGPGVATRELELRIGAAVLTYTAEVADDDSPDGPLRALQAAMRRCEAAVAATQTAAAAVFVDGPLAPNTPAGPFVGYVKRLLRRYLDPSHDALLAALRPGERTPLFLIRGGLLERFAWYLRIGSGRAIDTDLAGVVRCECSAAQGLAAARALADLAARELVRFASDPLRDPRAPQNLFPIGALETHLRHRLGDPLLLRRALEARLAAE